MANVQFDDQRSTYTVQKKSGLTDMVIKMGLAKDAKGAQVVLLIIAVIAAAIGLFFMFSGGSGGVSQAEIQAAQAQLEI
jgi:hypothetical protein